MFSIKLVQEDISRRLTTWTYLQISDFNGNYKRLVLCTKTNTSPEEDTMFDERDTKKMEAIFTDRETICRCLFQTFAREVYSLEKFLKIPD